MSRFEIDDADIKEFYPKFDPADLTDAERYWISTGIWNGELFRRQFAANNEESDE